MWKRCVKIIQRKNGQEQNKCKQTYRYHMRGDGCEEECWISRCTWRHHTCCNILDALWVYELHETVIYILCTFHQQMVHFILTLHMATTYRDQLHPVLWKWQTLFDLQDICRWNKDIRGYVFAWVNEAADGEVSVGKQASCHTTPV